MSSTNNDVILFDDEVGELMRRSESNDNPPSESSGLFLPDSSASDGMTEKNSNANGPGFNVLYTLHSCTSLQDTATSSDRIS